MLEHFKFLKSHARVTPKMTIPAPSTLHFRQGRAAISKTVYPDLEPFFDDLAKAYRAAIRAFYDAGCRYLQLDDTAWSMMCDPKERAQSKARGDDPDALPKRYARLTNAALARQAGRHGDHHAFVPRQFPLDLHRVGRLRVRRRTAARQHRISTAISSNTTATAPAASSRCAIFRKGKKQLVLGLVTSKSGTLEKKDDIKRRIDEATKYVALDQLCLSPQCGFASTEEGNVLAEDEQWAKLRMIVEMADEVWG